MTIAVDLLDGLSSSVAVKGPCKATTTANITLSGEQTINGIACVDGDRVLCKDQTTASQNGIYVVSTGDWERAKDFSRNNDVVEGTIVLVAQGSSFGLWYLSTDNPIVIGTTSLVFTNYNATVTGALVNSNNLSDVSSVITSHDNIVKGGSTATPSGGVLDLDAVTTPIIDISGGSFSSVTLADSKQRIARFSGAGTITVGASLIGNRGGLDITVAAGDIGIFRGFSGGIVRVWVFKVSGEPQAYETDLTALAADPGGAANFSFTATASAGVLTIALKDAAGSDPSSTSPVRIQTRSSYNPQVPLTQQTINAAMSLVLSAGSTLAAVANQPFRLWIVAFRTAAGGTNGVALGVINCLDSNKSIFPLNVQKVLSSTAEGGAGAADSAHVVYTTAAQTNRPFVILGYAEWNGGLATPGTWVDADIVRMVRPGIKYPGDVIQVALSEDAAVATGTTVLPLDDTIPQSGEGVQFMTKAITPGYSGNVLEVEHEGHYANSNTDTQIGLALFQDSVANALVADVISRPATAGVVAHGQLRHRVVGSVESVATTFKIRAGCASAGTITFNGSAGARLFGGVLTSSLMITELMT